MATMRTIATKNRHLGRLTGLALVALGAVCAAAFGVSSCRQVAGVEDITLTCTSTQTDANNCGACGHSCLGGACTAGACQPMRLFTDPSGGGALSLVVQGGAIYVLFYAAVWSCTLGPAGCTAEPVRAFTVTFTTSGILDLLSITAVGPDVYFAQSPLIQPDGGFGTPGGRVYRVGADGSGLRLVADSQPTVFAMAASDQFLFWANRDFPLTTGEIERCPRSGTCTPTALTAAGTPVGGTFTSATDLYFVTSGSAAGSGAIRSCALAGSCASTDLVYDGPAVDVDGVAAYDGVAAFASLTVAGSLSLVTSKRPAPADVAMLDTGIKWDKSTQPALALDDAYVYFTRLDRVQRYARGSGKGAEDVAVGQTGPSALAVDAAAIYWANADGSVWRLAK